VVEGLRQLVKLWFTCTSVQNVNEQLTWLTYQFKPHIWCEVTVTLTILLPSFKKFPKRQSWDETDIKADNPKTRRPPASHGGLRWMCCSYSSDDDNTEQLPWFTLSVITYCWLDRSHRWMLAQYSSSLINRTSNKRKHRCVCTMWGGVHYAVILK